MYYRTSHHAYRINMDAEVREVSATRQAVRGSSAGAQSVGLDDNFGGSAPRDVPLEMLEKALENACETLASLATNVMDFSYDSQHVLFSKVYVVLTYSCLFMLFRFSWNGFRLT